MKKILLAMFMAACFYTVHAQEVTYTTTTTNYAYQVPPPIMTNFQTNYPTVTQVTWMPLNDWWYATYTTPEYRINRVYYNTQPYYLDKNENFSVSLPVLNTFVPDAVIQEAITKHGNNIFSITAGKMSPAGQTYYVTLINNGQSEIVTLNDNSTGMMDHQ